MSRARSLHVARINCTGQCTCELFYCERFYGGVGRNIPFGKDQVSAKQERRTPSVYLAMDICSDSTAALDSAAGLLTEVPCVQACCV